MLCDCRFDRFRGGGGGGAHASHEYDLPTDLLFFKSRSISGGLDGSGGGGRVHASQEYCFPVIVLLTKSVQVEGSFT